MTTTDTDRPAAERHALAMLDLATAVYHAPNATLSAVAAAGYRAALRDLLNHASEHGRGWRAWFIEHHAADRGIDLTEDPR